MIDAIMAMVILVVGVIGTFTTFDGVQRLGMLGEKKQSATRYVQSEVENLRNLGWTNLRLTAAPPAAADTRGTVAGSTYAPPRGGTAQTLVVASNPDACTRTTCVDPTPEAWTYGAASGFVYRYVTGAHDGLCGSACPAGTTDYKRVTVAVTINGPNAPKAAIVASTFVIDPSASPANTSVNVNPVQSTGGASIGGATGTTYYLSDTATGVAYSAPSSNHAAWDTVTVSGVPDQLRTTPPAASAASTAYSYSSDFPPSSDGGIGLEASAGCAGGTRTNAHRWATPVLNAGSAVTATGNAALTIPTSLLPAQQAAGSPAKLCIRVYSVTLNGSFQVSASTLLGSFAYQLASWPKTTDLIAFPFRYLPTGNTASVAAGRRLLVELTADSAQSQGLAIVYDHPNYPASVQLETN